MRQIFEKVPRKVLAIALLCGVVFLIIVVIGFFRSNVSDGGVVVSDANVPEEDIPVIDENIRVFSPAPDTTIESPVEIQGEARGTWYFEGSFPARLLDAEGNELAVMPVAAQEEWMTTKFVPFTATLEFPQPKTPTGTLVLQKDNPSGLPEQAGEIRIPVRFADPSARPSVVPPLDRTKERVTKKPFGIYIDRATSPVQPERFSGYHTGTDFEIFSDEATDDVAVTAICSGKVVEKRLATGYGGVLVTDCVIDNKKVTVIYGHLTLSSIDVKVGERIKAGDVIGFLGAGGSSDTGGERKHLHLGIHLGSAVDILGYVPVKSRLSDWLDPCDFVCQ